MELLKNLEGLSADEQMSAVVELQKAAMKHLEEQKQASIGKSAEMVILGLKKIKSDFEAKFDSLNYDIQTKVANLKDGEQGLQGPKGEQGDRGLDGYQGKDGKSGIDGKDGLDGVDGVSVQDAKIDFDGSLVITLSDGKEINVGEVVPVDVAEKIRTVHNIQSGSGGDSQTVLDAIAALQATIATYGTMATQNANAVAITGGTINNTTVGATTPSTGVFTTLTAQNETLKGTGQNLLIYSNTFTNGAWTATGATVATTVVTTDPFGGSNAYLVTASVTGTAGLTSPSITATTSTYTLSLYAKAGTSPFLRIFTASNVWFNLSNGTLGTVGGGLTASITSAGNGWYRCVVSFTGTSGAFSPLFRLADADNATPATSGTTQFIYGAQLEISSVANTYIPTTTTAVYGTPTLSFSGVASIGLQSDGSLYETSAGTGNVRFYTNNIGQEQARVSHTASAVNYHQLTGSVTGSGPIHSVAGSDTNIDLNLTTKGTGGVNLNTGGGIAFKATEYFLSGTTANYIFAAGRQASNPPVLGSAGSDTNVSLAITSKGTGSISLTTSNGGLNQFLVAHTASAVNHVQVTGAATGSTPIISIQGSDAVITGAIQTKGGGSFSFYSQANLTARQVRIDGSVGNAVNYLDLYGAAASGAPSVRVGGSDTNIPLVLQPKGTGALQAQQTDSTATGGNARGANAVDWQMARGVAGSVATGVYSNIGGGFGNNVSGFASSIAGGYDNNPISAFSGIGGGRANVISSNASYSFVGGGRSNISSGVYNFMGGGFTNSGTANTAVTTQSSTMNATTAVTLAASNASIKVGQYITGTSIADDTYVAAISGTSLTLSKVASGSSTSTLSFYTPHGVVVGGGNNQATGSYSFIGGGGDAGTAANRNVASGDWSFVGGGAKNTASGRGSIIVGGGYAFGTFYANSATSDGSAILTGFNNTSSALGSVVLTGIGNVSSGVYSTVSSGTAATTRGLPAITVFGGLNPFGGSAGTCQSAIALIGIQTTDATATVLTANGSSASTINQVILPNNSAYTFRGEVVSGVTGGGNSKSWTIEGLIKRGANAASTTLVGSTVTSMYADVGAATWVIALSADTTNGGLAVTFTGQAATTIRTVCQIRTTEMTY